MRTARVPERTIPAAPFQKNASDRQAGQELPAQSRSPLPRNRPPSFRRAFSCDRFPEPVSGSDAATLVPAQASASLFPALLRSSPGHAQGPPDGTPSFVLASPEIFCAPDLSGLLPSPSPRRDKKHVSLRKKFFPDGHCPHLRTFIHNPPEKQDLCFPRHPPDGGKSSPLRGLFSG